MVWRSPWRDAGSRQLGPVSLSVAPLRRVVEVAESPVCCFCEAVAFHGADHHGSRTERRLGCFQLLQIKPLAVFVYRFPCEYTFPFLQVRHLGRVAVSGSKYTVTWVRSWESTSRSGRVAPPSQHQLWSVPAAAVLHSTWYCQHFFLAVFRRPVTPNSAASRDCSSLSMGLCPFLLRGLFPAQASNPSLLHCQVDSLPRSHQGNPFLL